MQPSVQTKSHWSTPSSGPWYRWRGYTVRWVMFGVIVQIFQPIDDGDDYWQQKLYQAFSGLLFGVLCAVVFTLAENKLNAPRIKWKSWSIVVATWVIAKIVFVSVLAATGGVQY